MTGEKPSRRVVLSYAEDALAIASWAEAQGFPDDAARMREFAAKVWPEKTARWQQRVGA